MSGLGAIAAKVTGQAMTQSPCWSGRSQYIIHAFKVQPVMGMMWNWPAKGAQGDQMQLGAPWGNMLTITPLHGETASAMCQYREWVRPWLSLFPTLSGSCLGVDPGCLHCSSASCLCRLDTVEENALFTYSITVCQCKCKAGTCPEYVHLSVYM